VLIEMPITQHLLCSVSGLMACISKIFDVQVRRLGQRAADRHEANCTFIRLANPSLTAYDLAAPSDAARSFAATVLQLEPPSRALASPSWDLGGIGSGFLIPRSGVRLPQGPSSFWTVQRVSRVACGARSRRCAAGRSACLERVLEQAQLILGDDGNDAASQRALVPFRGRWRTDPSSRARGARNRSRLGRRSEVDPGFRTTG
jgi:hypothetical protein